MIYSRFLIFNGSPFAHFMTRSYSGVNCFSGRGKQPPASTTKDNAAPLHKSTISPYPAAAQLPLPINVEDIEASEKARFSPERSRDISGPVITAKAVPISWNKNVNGESVNGSDPHVGSYDCRGTVSLSSVMQTNVPQPFSSHGKSNYLNMPGGQWRQGDKYVAEDQRNSHFLNSATESPEKSRKMVKPGTLSLNKLGSLCHNSTLVASLNIKRDLSTFTQYMLPQSCFVLSRHCSTNQSGKPLSRKEKLKQAVKDYGATVIVFHIGISLLSLGGFYLAVSSGIDVAALLHAFGASSVAAGASTFVIAYAVHKVFAPVRISITLAATPFIVRYLRRIGILKVKA